MRLQILLIPLFQVVLGESLREFSGYLGDTVTLNSGASSSWNLTRIVWSIFSNNTWIATYLETKENTDRLSQYKGRLQLNITSGDLKIRGLTQNDAMEYTVDLINSRGQNNVNKIKLLVRKRLQKPNIQTQVWVPHKPTKGGCWMEVRCSSPDEGVNLSWQIEPPSVKRNIDGNATLLAFINTTQEPVEFTCISSSKMENASSVVTKKCPDDKLQPVPQPDPQPDPQHQLRSRNALVFFAGFFIGVLATIIIKSFFGEKIKNAWESLKGKLCTQK